MRLTRLIGFMGAIAAAAVLIASAGAATTHSVARTNVTTHAGVLKYLKSLGVDPKTVVFQRGRHNYAGQACPGKRWNCTRARHVVQYGEGGGDNKFTCSASYGTPTGPPFPDTTLAPDKCVIVQVTVNGNNRATCTEQSSTPGVTQECEVYQQNATGDNRSKITQVIDQQDGQGQTGSQDAKLIQQNGAGKNASDLSQTIRQLTSSGGPSVNQSQDGEQSNTIDQSAATGDQSSSMLQSVFQRARAGGENDDSNAAQFDNAGPVSGNQSQTGDGQSDTTQNSAGVSKSDNNQDMRQFALAPKNAAVIQNQIGPWRCCSPQTGNPKDRFVLRQSKVQFASSLASVGGHGDDKASTFETCGEGCPPTSSQFLREDGMLTSTGDVHIRQMANQNGMTAMNRCDASNNVVNSCTASISGTDGVFVPPPFSCSTDTNPECGGFGGGAPVGAATTRATAFRRH